MQDPSRGRDQSVAALFLNARQSAQEFIGDILAQTDLAKFRALDVKPLAAQNFGLFRSLRAVLPNQLETRDRCIMDLAQIVVQARDFEPIALRIDHAPPRQIVNRGAPQHRLLASGVHGNVAADAGCVRGGRVDREYEAGAFGRFGHAFGDHAGRRKYAGSADRIAGQRECLDRTQGLELFRIDHRGPRRQRHRAARVSGAATARDDGESELDAISH